MATGRRSQLARQIGEHLVAAELGRQGYIATPFAGNVPAFDLLAANSAGKSISVQVKAIRGGSWQFNVDKYLTVEIIDGEQFNRGPIELPHADIICVFVNIVAPGKDEFFIFRFEDLQAHLVANYKGGRRPRNPESKHFAISPEELELYRDNWELFTAELGPGEL